MAQAPQTFQEYKERLVAKLNWIEQLSDKASSLDERLDLLVQIMLEQMRMEEVKTDTPLPAYQPAYNVRKYPLDTAITNQEVPISGNTIIAYTDGTLDGCEIALDDAGGEKISLFEFNPYYHSLGFSKFYLTTAAQSGKYLRLLVLRGTSSQVTGEYSQRFGLYLQPEWAAKEGIDKNFYATAANVATGAEVSLIYTVPSGKTLYIMSLSWSSIASAAANRDLNQNSRLFAHNVTDGINLLDVGGYGGGSIVLNKPFVFESGKAAGFYATNASNHDCTMAVSAQGYEV